VGALNLGLRSSDSLSPGYHLTGFQPSEVRSGGCRMNAAFQGGTPLACGTGWHVIRRTRILGLWRSSGKAKMYSMWLWWGAKMLSLNRSIPYLFQPSLGDLIASCPDPTLKRWLFSGVPSGQVF